MKTKLTAQIGPDGIGVIENPYPFDWEDKGLREFFETDHPPLPVYNSANQLVTNCRVEVEGPVWQRFTISGLKWQWTKLVITNNQKLDDILAACKSYGVQTRQIYLAEEIKGICGQTCGCINETQCPNCFKGKTEQEYLQQPKHVFMFNQMMNNMPDGFKPAMVEHLKYMFTMGFENGVNWNAAQHQKSEGKVDVEKVADIIAFFEYNGNSLNPNAIHEIMKRVRAIVE